MNMDFETIIQAALALPHGQRAEIAYQLICSLDGPEPTPAEQSEIDVAWAEEIERRARRIDEGKAKLIPGEQVMAELESTIARARAGRQHEK